MTTIYWRKYKYMFIKPNCIYTPGAIFCIERAVYKGRYLVNCFLK